MYRQAIEEAVAAVDLEKLVSSYVVLTRRKERPLLLGRCPFHREYTPSFMVDPPRKKWKCLGCGKGGDAFDFLKEYHDWSTERVLRELAEWF